LSARTKRDATTCDRKKHARTTAASKVMKKKPFVKILFSPFSLSQFQQGWTQTFERRIMSRCLYHCAGLREIAKAVGTTYEGYFRGGTPQGRHDTQHNDTQHKLLVCDKLCHYAGCRYAECRYAECRFGEMRSARTNHSIPIVL
jgi:hypothetical protein